MKNMKNILLALLAAMGMLATSCGKDDEGSRSGGFEVGIPSFVKQTTLIPVTLDVDCDAMPTVRFITENGGLGVVSPTQDVKLGVDYVYAGESVPVTFANGHASGTFWYIPLTPGDHSVGFEVIYRQGGEQRSGVNRKSFNVSAAANGGFYPEVYDISPGYYYFGFRNEMTKGQNGCKIYMRFGDVNGEKDPKAIDILLTQGKNDEVSISADTFYPIEWGKWDELWQNWINSDIMTFCNEPTEAITINLTFCDDFSRCRDVVVKMDKDCKLISSTASDYYLLSRDK